jgi:hypothetical protein
VEIVLVIAVYRAAPVVVALEAALEVLAAPALDRAVAEARPAWEASEAAAVVAAVVDPVVAAALVAVAAVAVVAAAVVVVAVVAEGGK